MAPRLSMAWPEVGGNAGKYVMECLGLCELAEGRFIREFEQKVAYFCGAQYAVATCNGTMADAVMLRALADRYPSDKNEVILPALTFAAQANAVLIAQLNPVFVDVDDAGLLNKDAAAAAVAESTLCVFPAHLLGVRCCSPLVGPIVEDACQATGIFQYGLAAAYSFYATHSITTGEGGAIVTDDAAFADECRRIANHGRLSDAPLDKFRFSVMGIAAKMSNITAAIGLAAMEIAGETLDRRKDIMDMYNSVFKAAWHAESPHAYPVSLPSLGARNASVLALEKAGIESRPMFGCLPHHDAAFSQWSDETRFLTAVDISEETLLLPIHSGVTRKDALKMKEIIDSC